MRILAICTVALAAGACQEPGTRVANGTADSQMTRSDSTAIVRAAWQALSSERPQRRVVWLWAPPTRDTSRVIPLAPGFTTALAQAGIPASPRQPVGNDTVVFRLTDWKTELGPERVVLEFQSEWTTVLGSGARRCRTGSGNVERLQVTRSDAQWSAKRVGPVVHGDKACVPLALLVARTASVQAAPQNRVPDLRGTSWQLVRFEGGDGTVLTPDDKAKYTIAFGTDGRLSVRIDCNRGSGNWESAGPNHLEFGPLAITRVMCPPGSLHDRIVMHWPFVRSYTMSDGHLFLSLMADGGIYEFEPMRFEPVYMR